MASIDVWWNTPKKPFCHKSIKKGWNVLSVVPWPWGGSSASSSTGAGDSGWQISFFLTEFLKIISNPNTLLRYSLIKKIICNVLGVFCYWNLQAGPWIYKIWYNSRSSGKKESMWPKLFSFQSDFLASRNSSGTMLFLQRNLLNLSCAVFATQLKHSWLEYMDHSKIITVFCFFYEDLNTTYLMSLQTTGQSMKFHKIPVLELFECLSAQAQEEFPWKYCVTK